MINRISYLIEKYWDGNTSLEEEAELKALLKNSKGHEAEKEFFLGIDQIKSISPQNIQNPGIKKLNMKLYWTQIAASLILLLVAGISIFSYKQKEAERHAFAQVMEAFSLIQHNMNKGTENLQSLQEFRHLNTTNQIFEIETN
ncbi:hypothetical protein ACFOUP_18015 [Belliella kenyensis]|uniref:Anti-sigma factor n=1 Tax=Belliella kenyensis TaxID=1472724 RepID=A0ABV8EPQ1_9BACT|nr:hypothetical protein [Belliella kenyensis]MCH7402608.1 hypothetical protein [Belliella kenyensis]MDN3603406.1 hypothetical protein [Belliella kenyensis]